MLLLGYLYVFYMVDIYGFFSVDFLLFNYRRRVDLIEEMLRIMALEKQKEELQAKFVEIVENIREIQEADSASAKIIRPLK